MRTTKHCISCMLEKSTSKRQPWPCITGLTYHSRGTWKIKPKTVSKEWFENICTLTDQTYIVGLRLCRQGGQTLGTTKSFLLLLSVWCHLYSSRVILFSLKQDKHKQLSFISDRQPYPLTHPLRNIYRAPEIFKTGNARETHAGLACTTRWATPYTIFRCYRKHQAL